MRIGHGYDVHAFCEGRPLVLGGVTVPYCKGLAGHSDADVLIHAVCDSLLGAAALGDIGQLFPDNDPATLGIDSRILLRKVDGLLRQNGYRVVNVDATVIAQQPKLRDYVKAMRQCMALDLSVSLSSVSVKATTEEGLGFTGAGQGIAAHAVCLIEAL